MALELYPILYPALHLHCSGLLMLGTGTLYQGHVVHAPRISSGNSPAWQSEQAVAPGSLDLPEGHLMHDFSSCRPFRVEK